MSAKQALQLIDSGEASCVVVQNGDIVHAACGRGVSPLLALYQNEPQKLKDAFVFDKIIGKAAAVILVLGGTQKVYGAVMSLAGEKYLKEHRLALEYGSLVDSILNVKKDGVCPIEHSVLDVDDLQQCYKRIVDTVKVLQEKK